MDEARQEERLLIGHVETTIRASPEQIIAYQMHYGRKIKLSQLDPIVDVRYEIDPGSEEPGATCLCSTSSRPLRSTTAPSWLHSRQNVCDAPPTYIWVNVPIDRHDKVPPEQGACRTCRAAAEPSGSLGMQMDRRTVSACSVDLKGRFPRQIANTLILPARPHFER